MIKAAAANVVGRSHAQSGKPCQDAFRTRNLGNRACIALADGAGSKRHSRVGANALVKLVAQLLLDEFDRFYTGILEAQENVAAEIITRCKVVLDEKAARRHCPVSEFASTLLFFACDTHRYIAGHIGDGVIVGRFGNRVVTLSEPQNGEYANATFFVTDPDAIRRLRLYTGEYGDNLGVVLMSDGTAESLYNKATRQAGTGVSRMLDVFLELSGFEMKKVFQENLVQVLSKKSFDDCAIAALVAIHRGRAKLLAERRSDSVSL
mgnify:CR=1 FL=1|jgi:hypothetical protein